MSPLSNSPRLNNRRFFCLMLIGLAIITLAIIGWFIPLRQHMRLEQRNLELSASISEARQKAAMQGSEIALTDSSPQSERGKQSSARLNEVYGKLPLQFEANEGQTDNQVKFISRGAGYNLFLTSTEAVLTLHKPVMPRSQKQSEKVFATNKTEANGRDRAQSAVVRMQLVGANTEPHLQGMDQQVGKTNYFIGNDPEKWRTNIANYSKVKYESVYPGIDLVYYGNQQQLEYDFIVAPGSDPQAIRLKFGAAQKVRIDKSGELVIGTKGAEIRQHKPVIYQEANGERKEIAGRYVIRGREVGFEMAEYDQTRTLMIDPRISYSTYIGGSGNESYSKIAVDSQGSAYITGYTNSTNFPTAIGLQATNKGNNAFVTKLDSTGTQLLYSTYIGGTGTDNGYNIAVDLFGDAFITGFTNSTNFPTVNAAQSTYGGGSDDAFVSKLSAAGSALVYSTYLGGSGADSSNSVVLDSSGFAYVTGETNSTNFPIVGSVVQPAPGGSYDAYVTKITDLVTISGRAKNVNGRGLSQITINLSGNVNERSINISTHSDSNGF